MKNKKQIEVKEAQSKPKRGRPTEIKRDITKTSQSGLREGLTRATFIIREDTLDKLKERAYTDRKKLKDLVTEALDYYLDNHKETKTSKSNIQIKVQVAKTILGNLEDLIDAGALSTVVGFSAYQGITNRHNNIAWMLLATASVWATIQAFRAWSKVLTKN